jgi:hypothetical protein
MPGATVRSVPYDDAEALVGIASLFAPFDFFHYMGTASSQHEWLHRAHNVEAWLDRQQQALDILLPYMEAGAQTWREVLDRMGEHGFHELLALAADHRIPD